MSPAPTRRKWARAACASTWCPATAATSFTVSCSATGPARASRRTTAARPASSTASRSPARGRIWRAAPPSTRPTRLTNVDEVQKIWDVNPSIGGPDQARQAVVPLHVPALGRREDQDRRVLRRQPVAFHLHRRHDAQRHRRRQHHQQCGARLLGGNQQGQVLGLSRPPAKVPRPLGHCRRHSARGRRRPGHPDELRQRHEVDAHADEPAAPRSRVRHLQPGIHRALSAERHRARGQGLGSGRPFADRASTTCIDSSNNRNANAWHEPGRSLLGRCARSWARRPTSPDRTTIVLAQRSPTATGGWFRRGRATCSRSPITLARRSRSRLRLPMDASNGIKRTSGCSCRTAGQWAGSRGTSVCATTISSANRGRARCCPIASIPGVDPSASVQDGKADPGAGCAGEVQNWKDISPRVGFAMDVFGNGRTAVKASVARYVAGQNVAIAERSRTRSRC